ncbi:lysozyme inhibitor LprI family protein [Roseomonas elaeocarpi]|uniref:Lysozyme inhibitor LprI family protein n=1 Tax=Roseomonas elaeocarpi TaxID=907779 RepID=A0ABV6JYG5_9PROT
MPTPICPMLPVLLVTLLLPVTAPWAQAAETPAPTPARAAPPVPESCRAAGTDATDCVERLARTEERRLDAAVEKLSSELRREPRRRQLVRSQRLWREYRDAQCDYVSLSVRQGAQPNRLGQAQCLLSETIRRNEEVAHMVPPATRGAAAAARAD